MRVAQLLFFAAVTFLLGSIALSIGGARPLAVVFTGTVLGSDEPFRIIAWVTVVGPIVFAGLALIAAIRPDLE